MDELTAFQRDLLRIVAGMNEPKGLEVKGQLENYYDEEINHGRLYPNLDVLVDEGFVKKGQHDRRSNAYDVTKQGVRAIEARDQWNEKWRKRNDESSMSSEGKQATYE
jgi:PadR family transcriptional regulator PadR